MVKFVSLQDDKENESSNRQTAKTISAYNPKDQPTKKQEATNNFGAQNRNANIR
jgi:hypothetical protein